MRHGLNMHARAVGLDQFSCLLSIQSDFFSVLVSINLSTHSVSSFGNWDTGINLQLFWWEMGSGWTCFSCFFVHNYFLVLFLSSLWRSQGYYLRFTTPDSAVNHLIFILKDGPLQVSQQAENVSSFVALKTQACCEKNKNILYFALRLFTDVTWA